MFSCFSSIVSLQNKKLDDFHLKEQIEKMTEDIQQGKLIQSMNLTGNIHAAKFKKLMQNPLAVRGSELLPHRWHAVAC